MTTAMKEMKFEEKAIVEDAPHLKNYLEKYKGCKIAVIGARYNYRGILSVVGETFFVLSNATAVEQTGPSDRSEPSVEDAIGSSVLIPFEAFECICQPNWSKAPLPGEDDFQM